MSTTANTVRLAGEDLGDHRHVCVLVDGPEEADPLLIPFITEGLDQHERSFQVVDPAVRDAHVTRLRESGIDVSAVMASGQLEVRTWADSYLRGGRFDRIAQLAYVKQSFLEGRDLGYRRTRFIGSMEWAVDGEYSGSLLRYESRLNDLVRRRPDILVCTYDLNRHSARTIADVLGVHPAAIVGGALRESHGPAAGSASARDRLLTAASKLFHETGIQATGVDSIIEAAGVAKATFYRHFPSKDDLVVAWLRDPRTRWHDRVRAQVEESQPTPHEAIPLFFEAVAEWLENEGYRGCPYLNTAVEITQPTHPALPVVLDYLQEVEDYITGLVTAAGYRNPRMLAIELQTLLAGAISLAVARRSGAYAISAREAAISMLAGAERV
jgi:AcrR family transcriptional regulator